MITPEQMAGFGEMMVRTRLERLGIAFFAIGFLPWCYLLICGFLLGFFQRGKKFQETLSTMDLIWVSVVQGFLFAFGLGTELEYGGFILFLNFVFPIVPLIFTAVFWLVSVSVFCLSFVSGSFITILPFVLLKKTIKAKGS